MKKKINPAGKRATSAKRDKKIAQSKEVGERIMARRSKVWGNITI